MKRNLIYYVYPRQCSMLALNLYLLRKYSPIFNGRKIIFAVEEEGLVDQLHITWMFNDTHDIRPYELIMVPPGQDACFPKMLKSIQSTDPNEITFYAHTKDTTLEALHHKDIADLSVWVEEMYRDNLEDPEHVDAVMKKHPCAGTFKYKDFHGLVWSYRDNFFWFNHQQLFSKDWDESSEDPYVHGWHPASISEYLHKRFSYKRAYNFRVKKSDRYTAMIVKNWDPSRVTLVTTCKNRWDFLNRSLPTWLNKGFKKIIVVDWSSDEDIAEQIEHMPAGSTPVSVVRVEGEEIFNGGMARNTGAKHIRTDYALFIDSDMVMKDWSLASSLSLVPGKFFHGPHNIPPFGTSLVRMEDFKKVNGYSELYPAYGWEDNDLYNRLEASGVRRCFFDERMVEHIDHDDFLRAQYRDQKGRKLHETIWANRDTVEAWTPNHKCAEKAFSVKEFML